MTNYYEILSIRLDATRDEVKASFRALAKRYHPDFHPDKSRWAHDRMQDLLRAYEVLFNPEKRAVYDRTLSHLEKCHGSSFRESLRKNRSDPAACCELIFLDLLEGRGREGMALYEELCATHHPFKMEEHMKIGDSLDCGFLLAEEYERQHRARAAFALYRHVHEQDLCHRYFGHFRAEIVFRMRQLVIAFLKGDRNLPFALEGFAGALREHLPRRERAFIYKKMAEGFMRRGEERLARLTLVAALQLHPGLGGTKKIRTRLRMGRLLLGR
ncbi:MAG: DnaJ domain-containing protein [Candidatus Aureabacteria bacterium]|nr:DnaJ domain-containing protein [Candidatus Auribacterota bacterium]